MRIALIADTFPPLRSSGAVQLRDLSREFVAQGHILYVLLPSHGQVQSWLLDEFSGVKLLRLKAPKTRNVGYVRRALAEFYIPISMLCSLLKSPLAKESWEGLIWYSPSIFFGPLVNYLKKRSKCKSYLIVRDIFPQWAVDMGLMRRGFAYRFLDFVARYQYSVADTIGIQTQGNEKYFKGWLRRPGRRLEVLRNWLGEPARTKCSLELDKTILRGRKIFVYAGNMGVAQGLDVVLDLASCWLVVEVK
jgi:glycosyltransferase involved in cell wall biosynthesis